MLNVDNHNSDVNEFAKSCSINTSIQEDAQEFMLKLLEKV